MLPSAHLSLPTEDRLTFPSGPWACRITRITADGVLVYYQMMIMFLHTVTAHVLRALAFAQQQKTRRGLTSWHSC
ncbi:hypothetical protein Mapa_002933 [Marchantia paleacea]|nr:hypothetical protein Mapa_002933 [Marchantia paleacea]